MTYINTCLTHPSHTFITSLFSPPRTQSHISYRLPQIHFHFSFAAWKPHLSSSTRNLHPNSNLTHPTTPSTFPSTLHLTAKQRASHRAFFTRDTTKSKTNLSFRLNPLRPSPKSTPLWVRPCRTGNLPIMPPPHLQRKATAPQRVIYSLYPETSVPGAEAIPRDTVPVERVPHRQPIQHHKPVQVIESVSQTLCLNPTPYVFRHPNHLSGLQSNPQHTVQPLVRQSQPRILALQISMRPPAGVPIIAGHGLSLWHHVLPCAYLPHEPWKPNGPATDICDARDLSATQRLQKNKTSNFKPRRGTSRPPPLPAGTCGPAEHTYIIREVHRSRKHCNTGPMLGADGASSFSDSPFQKSV